SSGVRPERVSTTKRITAACSMAVSICFSIWAVRLSTSWMPMPPVSTSSTKRSPILSKAETRSRVTPAVGSTLAMRPPASQLNSDDLPTLGRPTMATTGTAKVQFPDSKLTEKNARGAPGVLTPSVESRDGRPEILQTGGGHSKVEPARQDVQVGQRLDSGL